MIFRRYADGAAIAAYAYAIDAALLPLRCRH